ncbi:MULTISPECIES: DUF397 domain-containing protein [Streptomyces]|uniref:DUF397 domain-containing protein n=2 Tax=Streptomyces rimosus subsp. rimosus TaxID=132474 RepID=L8EZJ1_STRR1|nr:MULTISPECIES: DUF397 domain-containing protein [Streptomyces]MYT47560.1 DUF397 domain-containing protein [Streptomyces sp. SID5471]QDA06975.1 DUF397 domain-containing protein [Streptomyces rimosus]QEV78254.1 DUF397 domain-containing protein [Streptomyces rimosus]QGY69366.1 DUF397 domain-containing protein [Streptomyces rimosus R6-500]QST81005.1 DUF397 domain-containing protein [Streptomyces rimosus subsp. rimosus ATCC 10970]
MTTPRFRKPSHSNHLEECVEVATTRHTITIRDTNHPTGPTLHLSPTAWAYFLVGLNAEPQRQPASPALEPGTAVLTKQMSPVGAGANPGPH